MRPLPENKLDPRVTNVWRINDGIWITLVCGLVVGMVQLLRLLSAHSDLVGALTLAGGVAWVVLMVLWLVVLPPIRYVRWRYQITDDYLDIARGIVWRKRFVIPFIRVQNTDTRQGPILRAFKLASVTVSTAAKEHVIPGLDFETAEQLRDRAAELARLAREDV